VVYRDSSLIPDSCRRDSTQSEYMCIDTFYICQYIYINIYCGSNRIRGVTPLNQNICICDGSVLMGRPVWIHYTYVRMSRIHSRYVNIHIYIHVHVVCPDSRLIHYTYVRMYRIHSTYVNIHIYIHIHVVYSDSRLIHIIQM